ncbi:MAG: hypothetical protein J6Z36_02335 [Clostridia bacterium]|nr:hypothetical protein [Clostridia bacterium]
MKKASLGILAALLGIGLLAFTSCEGVIASQKAQFDSSATSAERFAEGALTSEITQTNDYAKQIEELQKQIDELKERVEKLENDVDNSQSEEPIERVDGIFYKKDSLCVVIGAAYKEDYLNRKFTAENFNLSVVKDVKYLGWSTEMGVETDLQFGFLQLSLDEITDGNVNVKLNEIKKQLEVLEFVESVMFNELPHILAITVQ